MWTVLTSSALDELFERLSVAETAAFPFPRMSGYRHYNTTASAAAGGRLRGKTEDKK